MSDNEDSKTKYEKDLVNLATAIKDNNTEQALDLIKKVPAEHLFHPDNKGRTFLHYAINLDDRKNIASALIGKFGVTAGQLLFPDNNGKTALDDAIRLGKGSIITEILTNGSIKCKIHSQTFNIIPTKDLTKIIPQETFDAAKRVLASEMIEFKIANTKIDNRILKTDKENLEAAELELMFSKKSPKREGEALDRETLKLNTQFLKPDGLIRRSHQYPIHDRPRKLLTDQSAERRR